jgi:ATP-binding cassette subfamily B protein
MPSPQTLKALADFMSVPLIRDQSDPAKQAEAVLALINSFKSLPPEFKDKISAPSVSGEQSPSGDASGRPGSGFTPEQMDDALRAIRATGGKFDYAGIGAILWWLLALYLMAAGFTFATQWIMSAVAQRTVYDLRRTVNQKLGRLPLSYFDKHPHGDVLSRVTNDVDTISGTLQQSLTQAITSVVQLIGFIVMMLSISWLLTLIVLATLPLYVVATMAIAKQSQKHFAAQQKELGAISGHIEEMYTGHVIVKAFGRERESIKTFDAINERLAQAGRQANFISGVMWPVMSFISNLGYVMISVFGGIWITGGRLSLGDIVAFIQYSRSFTQPIMQTAQIANIIQSTVACAERVFEVLDEAEESPEPIKSLLPRLPKGQVRIENLAFRYTEGTPLIESLSLDVKPGHTIAIVGPTGAGKTTLVNLLMRFYEIRGGSIKVDGVAHTDMARADLRSLFGMVLQDTWLFNGSIRDNIAYGKDGATEAEILRAAQAAHADHFIRTLPEGYDTVLNEEATNISQGQKQLLTIARAILANPAILILDEATSSVDTRTEVLIQKAMRSLMEGRTSFVIAHRLSTIRDAETILVMDKGSIVEQGTHQQLLAKNGFYAELYNAQFAGQAL